MKKIATPLAVIDVGSNSLRLVVYNQIIYPFKILFQKREFLKLGENLDQRNRIISTKIRKAQIVLEKFISEAANYSVSHTYILATAAIRESKNGKELFKKITKYKSISSNIISSLQEAKYAAYGVISSLDKPKGVVADLGGGSLEIAEISLKKILHKHSLKIGLLRSDSNLFKNNKLEFDKLLIKEFNKIKKNKFVNTKYLYAIGGAWRNLAKLDLHLKGFKKNKLHGYVLSSADLKKLYHELSITKESKIKKINIVQVNRVPTLVLSVYILYMLVSFFNVKEIVFVRYGIREGFIYHLAL